MLSVLHSSYARLARLRMNASSWINNASPPLKQVIRWPTVHLCPMGQVCPVCGQFFVFWIIQEELHLCQRPRSVWHQHETVALFAHAPCLHQALWYSASYCSFCAIKQMHTRKTDNISHLLHREICVPGIPSFFFPRLTQRNSFSCPPKRVLLEKDAKAQNRFLKEPCLLAEQPALFKILFLPGLYITIKKAKTYTREAKQ